MTVAAVHDRRVMDDILDPSNTVWDVYADRTFGKPSGVERNER
jgi:hypothetical protein